MCSEGSWLCENALAEELTPLTLAVLRGAVILPRLATFPAVGAPDADFSGLGGSATADSHMSTTTMLSSPR
jgi:hypothetical protein